MVRVEGREAGGPFSSVAQKADTQSNQLSTVPFREAGGLHKTGWCHSAVPILSDSPWGQGTGTLAPDQARVWQARKQVQMRRKHLLSVTCASISY